MLELLLNADVYAPAPLGHQNLLIGGERVLWMGSDVPQLDRSLLAATRDLEGRRLIPGLVDGHAHLTGGGGEAGFKTRVPPVALSRYTRGGITTVVGTLGTDDLVRTPGGLVATARGLIEEGLSAWAYTGGYHLPPATITGSVRGDIVHIDRIIGVGEVAISDHRSSQPTQDELLRLASEAHVGGLMTGKAGIVHLHLGDGERGLEPVRRALAETELPASVFYPTHVNRRRALFDEALELTRQSVVVDVTAFPVEDGEDAWSAEDALGRYLDSGASVDRITVSTDAGGCLPRFDADGRVESMEVGQPDALATTLRACLTAGRLLEEVLPAFTETVARTLRLPRKGRVAAGMDADLVVLDDRHEIRDVMALGRWHVRDGEVAIHGTFEAP